MRYVLSGVTIRNCRELPEVLFCLELGSRTTPFFPLSFTSTAAAVLRKIQDHTLDISDPRSGVRKDAVQQHHGGGGGGGGGGGRVNASGRRKKKQDCCV